VTDALRDVHNHGADLYNQAKDYAGAYRVYEGALKTVRPLMAHRPATQKTIEEGLAAAGRETDAAKKAFALHEAIEKVRADLKDAAKATAPKNPTPSATTPEPKKTTTPEPKKITTPEPKKTTTPEPKKTVTPDPAKSVEPAPTAKKGAAAGAGVRGVVTYKGQPLGNADLLFVSLDRPAPVAMAAKSGADGTYAVPALAPGRYAVTVVATANGKALLPARYATTDTSGLTVTVPAGGGATFDISLQ
jgi:outer membrane biosynthesis protein TonB